jgi:glycogen debranching enzyme
MSTPNDRSRRVVVGDERFAAIAGERPVTTSAERYVMSESRARRLVIKEGELFLYTDEIGHMAQTENSVLGLYYRDTRYLSRLEMKIGGREPVLLSATAERDYLSTMEFTNLEMKGREGTLIPQASIHVRRTRFVADKVLEMVRVRNYASTAIEVMVDLYFDADFADFFEVRGLRRRRRGTRLAPKANADTLTLAYLGLDELLRKTVIRFEEQPESIREGRVRYRLSLKPGERHIIRFEVAVEAPGAPVEVPGDFNEKLGGLRRDYERWMAESTDIFTDNEQFTAVLRRAQTDLRMLLARTDYGSVPLAGIPWFGAPFGRDAILVGIETMMLDQRLATDSVRALTGLQGRTDSVFREEQPGKIMHELRQGELANLRAIPHTPYFGAVDTTPLYLLLLCEVVMWSGDLEFFELLHEPILAALRWIDDDGDADGDGFVEYSRRSRTGLINQGWRDADNAVVHADGTLAEGPIALADVQGYVFHAKRRLASLFGELGDVERSQRLQSEAQELKRRFNEAFWLEDEQFVAMALDGAKRPVATVTSSAGHCLWSRIVDDEHVPAVVRRLLAPDMFSGWGVRTMSKLATAYNPVSFYNGSVWPFDNAFIARGLKKLGYAQEANRIASGLFDAAVAHEYSRLPELFCGFSRQATSKPVSFPMSCTPDAAASGAMILVLQAMLGLYAAAEENILYVHNPVLPKWLGEVSVGNLHLGRSKVSLRFRREGSQTTFSVLDKQGPARIVVVE